MSGLINMTDKIKRLKSGAGVQSLLDSAYEITGNPVALFDTEYNLQAYTDVETDDPIWTELVTTGTFSRETQMLFENEGFIEEVANAKNTVLLHSDKIKYDRISGKVFNKNNTYVSNLITVACLRPFEKGDQEGFEALCNLISGEISGDEFYLEYGQAHQEAVIKNLIEGNYDKGLDMAQVEIIYSSLLSKLYVAVLGAPPFNAEYGALARVRNLLMEAEPAYKYSVYSNYIVVIISTNDGEGLNMLYELSGIIRFLERHNMYAGISGMFENLFELNRHYSDALTMLKFISECKCPQRIFSLSQSASESMRRLN